MDTAKNPDPARDAVADLYPARLLDHYQHPRGRGLLSDATHTGRAHNPLCGDELTVSVRMEHGQIVAWGWEGVGCAISLGAASLLTEAAQGTDPAAWDPADVASMETVLGTPVPATRSRCALLPAQALAAAMDA